MTVTRPTLNSVCLWRAETVAKREGRSLANAIEKMVQESWDFRMASHQASFLPVVPGSIKERAAGTLSLHAPARLIEAVEAIAAKESRATSAVLNILVAEALAARAATTAPAEAA